MSLENVIQVVFDLITDVYASYIGVLHIRLPNSVVVVLAFQCYVHVFAFKIYHVETKSSSSIVFFRHVTPFRVKTLGDF